MSSCFSGWAVLFRYPAESFFFIVLSIGFPTQLSKKNIEGIVSVTVEECSPVSRAALIRFPVYAFLLFDATVFQLNYVKYVRGMSTGGAAAELFISNVCPSVFPWKNVRLPRWPPFFDSRMFHFYCFMHRISNCIK